VVIDTDNASGRWAEMLAAWAIPDRLLAGAPESPYFFAPQVFIAAADKALSRPNDTPSDEVAREVLPVGGSVLDVGCGAGAASLRLRPGRVTGVDPSGPLLAAFSARATGLGIDVTTIQSAWPDVAPRCDVADVVVCHHVLYNVAHLAEFVAALYDHARRRVVVELTAQHPMAWMAPYWKALHGLDQPDRPTVDDAITVLTSLGFAVQQFRWSRAYQMIGETDDEALHRIARRLCLPPDRYDELRTVLAYVSPPADREVVTLWWS
jgi:SAM-dependent methyltransferase